MSQTVVENEKDSHHVLLQDFDIATKSLKFCMKNQKQEYKKVEGTQH